MSEKMFGLYVNNVCVRIAASPSDLREQFCAEFGEWVTSGEIGRAPVIRPVAPSPITSLVATGSTTAQVAEIIDALKHTVRGGTLDLTTTSRHIANWLSGDWKTKSPLAQQLIAAVSGQDVKVVVKQA